jgi:hypothetical protein
MQLLLDGRKKKRLLDIDGDGSELQIVVVGNDILRHVHLLDQTSALVQSDKVGAVVLDKLAGAEGTEFFSVSRGELCLKAIRRF